LEREAAKTAARQGTFVLRDFVIRNLRAHASTARQDAITDRDPMQQMISRIGNEPRAVENSSFRRSPRAGRFNPESEMEDPHV
jgi:hypothetical protein